MPEGRSPHARASSFGSTEEQRMSVPLPRDAEPVLLEELPGTVQPPPDRGVGSLDDGHDLLAGEALDVAEHDHLAELRRELLDDVADELPPFLVLHRGGRP